MALQERRTKFCAPCSGKGRLTWGIKFSISKGKGSGISIGCTGGHILADRVCDMVTDVLGQKSDKKTPVCETVVWLLPDWVKNLNASVRRPSKLPLIDGQRTPALELLPSRSWQMRWRRPKGGEFSFLTSDADIKKEKKKTKFTPFHSAPLYVAIRKATILTPASVVYQ